MSTLQEYIELIKYANAPIFGIDTNGYITEWNDKTLQITGFSKEETLGKLLLDFIESDYKESVTKVLSDALEGINCDNYELPLLTKDSQRRFLLVNATTRRNVSGDITGVIGVAQDITNEKIYQKEQESLQLLLELCPDIIFVKADRNTRLWTYVSPSFEKLFYPTKIYEVMKKPGTYFISREEEVDEIVSDIEHKENKNNRKVHFKFPGNTTEYHVSYSSVFKDDEVFLYFRPLNTEDRLDWIVQNTSDVISLHNRKTFQAEEVNAAGLKVLGYSKEELQTSDIMTLVEPGFKKELDEQIESLDYNGKETMIPLQMQTKHDGFQWMEMSMRLVDDQFICVTRSIEERVRREKAERELLLKEEARKKEIELVHFLSHQLKNALIAAIYMLESTKLAIDNQRETLRDYNNIFVQIKDLMGHLENAKAIVLNEAAIRSILYDEYVIDYKCYNMSELDEKLFRRRITTSYNKDMDIQIDTIPMDHIISNLVDNAIKYGSAPFIGKMNVYSRYTETDINGHELFDFRTDFECYSDEYIWLEILIKNGFGNETQKLKNMSTEDKKQLFQKGNRMSEDCEKTSNGHGTWIILKCLEVLKGSINICTKNDQVISSICIPIKHYINIEEIPKLPFNVCLYILDDNDIQRKIYSKIVKSQLKIENFKIFGETKNEIKTFHEKVFKNQPEILILDQNLDNPEKGSVDYSKPFVLGTDIVKKIRLQNKNVIIFIRSANNSKSDIQTYMKSGADSVLPKDLNGKEMMDKINEIVYKLKGKDWYNLKNNEMEYNLIESDDIKETLEFDIKTQIEELKKDSENKWAIIHRIKGNMMGLTNKTELIKECEMYRYDKDKDVTELITKLDKEFNHLQNCNH